MEATRDASPGPAESGVVAVWKKYIRSSRLNLKTIGADCPNRKSNRVQRLTCPFCVLILHILHACRCGFVFEALHRCAKDIQEPGACSLFVPDL